MKNSLVSITVTILTVAFGTLAAPQARAEVDGYFYKSGSQCYENERDPRWAWLVTACRFWVPARFTQNSSNVVQLTIKSSCRPKYWNVTPYYSRNNFIEIHYMYQPKDTSLWHDAAYDNQMPNGFFELSEGYEFMGFEPYGYDLGNDTMVFYLHLNGVPGALVDKWWPRYVSLFFSFVKENGLEGPPETFALSRDCIKSLELYNISGLSQY